MKIPYNLLILIVTYKFYKLIDSIPSCVLIASYMQYAKNANINQQSNKYTHFIESYYFLLLSFWICIPMCTLSLLILGICISVVYKHILNVQILKKLEIVD
jgi:uncharacterized membrane protein